MVKQTRPNDNELIAQMAGDAGIGQQGSSGGNLQREVGERDELKAAGGGDPLPTSVDGRDKPDDGDLPTRLQTRK